MNEEQTTLPTQPFKTGIGKLGQGTRRNSESLGMCLSIIGVWLLNDVLKANIPMPVMGAIFTTVGIIAGRLRDSA